MVRYCSVYGCLKNSNANKYLRFFRFPADETRCKQWINTVGRQDLESKSVNTLHKSYFVCELHFDGSDCPIKYLRGNAIPKLLLPQLEDTSGTSKYTQTDNMLCYSCKSHKSAEIPCTLLTSQSTQTTKILYENIPCIKKLRLELQAESKKRRLVECMTENVIKANQIAESKMPPLLKKIVDAQKVAKRKTHGARYDQDYMTFALNIFSVSPVAYKLLSETLCLPSTRTLKRHIALGTGTNLNENVIKEVQVEVQSETNSHNVSESEK